MDDLQFISRYQNDAREWAVIGPLGAVQVWTRYNSIGFIYGGVEYHIRSTLDNCTKRRCHLLNGPCKHDGSSLQFDLHIAPALLPGLKENDAFMRHYLTRRYEYYFHA